MAVHPPAESEGAVPRAGSPSPARHSAFDTSVSGIPCVLVTNLLLELLCAGGIFTHPAPMVHLRLDSRVLVVLVLIALAGCIYQYKPGAVVGSSPANVRYYLTQFCFIVGGLAWASSIAALVRVEWWAHRAGMSGFARLVRLCDGSFVGVCLPQTYPE